MPDFFADLDFGEQYQLKCKDIFEYETFNMKQGYFKEYDIEMSFKADDDIVHTTLEVKADRRARQTGNLAIEYESNGKPSGIITTTATWWVHFVDGENVYYMIPTKVLRKAVKNCLWWRTAVCRDEMESQMYLFERGVFEKYKHEY